MSTTLPLREEQDTLRQRVAQLEQALAERDRTIAALQQHLEGFRAMEREQQRLLAVIENSRDFIALADTDGRVTYVNQAGLNMVGIDGLDDAQRSYIPEYFTPEDAAYVAQHILPDVIQKGIWQGDFRFRHMKTGASVPIHYSVFPIKDKDTGELLSFATVTRDITDRKKAEEEQARLKDELIRAQAAALEQLSTPLIPITEDVVVMPLIGTVDSRRAQQVMEGLLHGVVNHRSHTVILDITGVSTVDSAVADALIRAAQAVRLLGARTVITGISPHVAQTLVGMGIDLRGVVTHGTLQSGIAWATAQRAARTAPQPARRPSL